MSPRRTAPRIAAAATAVSAIALPTCAHATGLSTAAPAHATAADQAGFVMDKAQSDRMFPNRDRFSTYDALVGATSAYPGFAHTGNDALKRREAAAFLANASHETGGLRHVVEQNTANYPTYCDTARPYGCPAERAAYYGRGPLQLSSTCKAAGDALHIDLLHHPDLLQTNPQIAWKSALWYWNTQSGPGSMTAHHAIVTGAGSGQTIRSINGAVECDGRNTAEMQDRVNLYQRSAHVLGTSPGTSPGTNLTC
ncbi:chitinase [Kitasatospora sp. NPDC056731]|uniref:chitinase n=1 Tax=Kitasatospora sp. NPDC056731 TaxID=3155422 RepID=UPI003434BFF8